LKTGLRGHVFVTILLFNANDQRVGFGKQRFAWTKADPLPAMTA